MDEPPAEVTQLFPELPAPGLRQFEITAVLPDSTCPTMHIIAAGVNVVSLFAEAFDACQSVPDFELKIRPLDPAAH